MRSAVRSLLLVHAHPDDESIGNGVTMARSAAAGDHVTLVTCTLGEEGEVIPRELASLAPDRDDRLGPHRAGELAAAMRALGVRDHRFLGGRGRWRDSGMMGAGGNDRPEAFWQADVDEAAGLLAGIIRETTPQVMITYGPDGGYGHPDHIQAHRVAMRAAEIAAGPGPEAHRVTRILWNCLPRSAAGAALERLRAVGPGRFAGVAGIGDLSGVGPDGQVALAVTGKPRELAAKAAAMRAHATQIDVEDRAGEPAFALSNALVQPLWSTEYYQLAAGEPFPPGADDVFAGLPGATGRAGTSGTAESTGGGRTR
ncbi:N-acetyl-1-D-myo-inositol-2-amino-2-deoxy-alpha-D-glucopyranoside deacetylase [Streptomyces sp. ACA25]|uniref:N-acetyl-1-D-myo-inositol-2-amino-2-deoxy-alpha- D-glucopyranoside deacetylase n=1 Tax=Streptomyces sp. ACA25 TaxID=3022596 RepID=UPI0023081407|nr:N-acetyl-1-D-myo-inositol-2-amino-2-deoxy-alpha-D-glucopyranoside deacetylase [Streptomyces sp. ACA25]MDB1086894.1 N-acetyl-1-D-myo-inositol-2-amino-2-deoxy-alpha-D-glucopyranoside deacetylase [Streptomyces sp. ACA25]